MKFWEGLKQISVKLIVRILEAGKMIYEPKEIANTFNTHFSTISCKLISQLPASATNYQDYLGSSNPSSMFFYPTCP